MPTQRTWRPSIASAIVASASFSPFRLYNLLLSLSVWASGLCCPNPEYGALERAGGGFCRRVVCVRDREARARRRLAL